MSFYIKTCKSKLFAQSVKKPKLNQKVLIDIICMLFTLLLYGNATGKTCMV